MVLKQIWLLQIIRSMFLMCQNTTMWVYGTWIKRYCVLCSKTYNTLHSCDNFPAGSWQASRGACICETSLLQWHHMNVNSSQTKQVNNKGIINALHYWAFVRGTMGHQQHGWRIWEAFPYHDNIMPWNHLTNKFSHTITSNSERVLMGYNHVLLHLEYFHHLHFYP